MHIVVSLLIQRTAFFHNSLWMNPANALVKNLILHISQFKTPSNIIAEYYTFKPG